jgi:hypothetical protein
LHHGETRACMQARVIENCYFASCRVVSHESSSARYPIIHAAEAIANADVKKMAKYSRISI